MEEQAVFRQIKRDVGHVQAVVGEIFLDHVALEAAADDEVADAVGVIDLHDVPEDRLAADLDHRLRLQMRLLGNTRAKPASQNHRFHEDPPKQGTAQQDCLSSLIRNLAPNGAERNR